MDEVKVKTGLPVLGLEVEVVDDKGNPVPHNNSSHWRNHYSRSLGHGTVLQKSRKDGRCLA